MGTADVVVVAAEHDAQVKRVTVVVRGGYSPQRIEAVAGVPLQIVFDRQESGDCTSRVIFPDLGITRALPAYERTTVEFVPRVAGELGFSCAMNMVHGSLTVTAANGTAPAEHGAAPAVDEGEPTDAAA